MVRHWLLGLVLSLSLAVGAQPLDEAQALHYLRRTRLVFSNSDLEQVTGTELTEQLQRDLSLPDQDTPLLRDALGRLPYQGMEPKEIYLALLDEPRATAVIEEEMMRARLLRGLLSESQLREVMTDFWFNHFNADPDKGEVVACNIARLERELRSHALGNFEQILRVAVRNPAVLENLDNTVSDGRAVNENFGRELMELYTTGPVHTQTEVVEVARCFSGWSYENDPDSPEFLRFRYYPELHAKGPKVVFGRTYGDHQQDELLHDLAHHPATARFISRKLVVRLVSDQPPEALVARATSAFQKSGGEIDQVLEVILTSPEFFQARGSKLKTPVEFAISALYHSGLDEELIQELAEGGAQSRRILATLSAMGSPYSCPNPLGWPDSSSVWSSTMGLRQRQKLARTLALRASLTEPAEVVKAHLFGLVSASTRAALSSLQGQPQELHVAALTSPEFQAR